MWRSYMKPMYGTTPVPGPTIIIGVSELGGNLNRESLIKIRFVMVVLKSDNYLISCRNLEV